MWMMMIIMTIINNKEEGRNIIEIRMKKTEEKKMRWVVLLVRMMGIGMVMVTIRRSRSK